MNFPPPCPVYGPRNRARRDGLNVPTHISVPSHMLITLLAIVTTPVGCSWWTLSTIDERSLASVSSPVYTLCRMAAVPEVFTLYGGSWPNPSLSQHCLLYTSDAADDLLCVDLG